MTAAHLHRTAFGAVRVSYAYVMRLGEAAVNLCIATKQFAGLD